MTTIKRVISIISVFSILLITGSVLAGPPEPEASSPKPGGPGVPSPTVPSWTSVLKSHADWLKNKPEGAGDYSINIVLVYNNEDGEAGYAEGALGLVEATQDKPPHQAILGTSLEGEVTLYKNTDRWGVPEVDPEDPEAFEPEGEEPYPFDPDQTEQLKVKIDVKTGQVEIGASTITKPEYSKGVAFGFEKKPGKSKYYVISLNRQFVPPVE